MALSGVLGNLDIQNCIGSFCTEEERSSLLQACAASFHAPILHDLASTLDSWEDYETDKHQEQQEYEAISQMLDREFQLQEALGSP
jgi:hypothetical protein